MLQPDLWDRSRRTEALAKVADPEQDYDPTFHNWLVSNFHIYLAFERRALRAVRSGFSHCGAMMIINQIRWLSGLAERESEFKINNNHAPDLARLFEDLNPQHEGFFRMRIRKVAHI